MLQLSDKRTEGKAGVRVFLDFIHGEPIPAGTTNSIIAMTNAYLIARKYGCRSVMTNITLALESCILAPNMAVNCFEALGSIGDYEQCARVIKKCHNWQWTGLVGGYDLDPSKKGSLRDVVPGSSSWDGTTWNLAAYERVPRKVLLGLLCASKKSRSLVPLQLEAEAISAEFLRLLTPPIGITTTTSPTTPPATVSRNWRSPFRLSRTTSTSPGISESSSRMSVPTYMSELSLTSPPPPYGTNDLDSIVEKGSPVLAKKAAFLKSVKGYEYGDVALLTCDEQLFYVHGSRLKAAR